MFDKILALFLLVLTLTFVAVNTAVLDKQIDEILESVSALEITDWSTESASLDAEKIYDDFKRRETYISLTVNHNDLTSIEEGFAELVGYLSVGDADNARVTKNRLQDALEHLGRLSGFNIDAII